ncbi:hypothetical protein D9757_014246 [Collybiopsis confluens]|uniref:Uncharacterized protein n=1 Tax=Collybiopsis confluens TaxID=2823264 RepID=A0A8H5G5S5_9AGAR|nr:hypothetical protein D9757_014246 [Collybiopsis confluens]
MYRVGGWIITQSVAQEWFQHHYEADEIAKYMQMPHVHTNLVAFCSLRARDNKPLPFKPIQIDFFAYPKMTPEDVGGSVCFLMSRLNRTSKGSWKNFGDLDMRDEDVTLVTRCNEDGLRIKIGDWMTVADPWEAEWPFYLRYPGQSCPQDPAIARMEERLSSSLTGHLVVVKS